MKQLLALCTALLPAFMCRLRIVVRVPRVVVTALAIALLPVPGVIVCTSSAHAQSAPGNLNGIAAFEQLRKEYYIGALYLGGPAHDTATIMAMPGKRRMELHITADRWPALRFAQMWNQSITINTDSATLNANAMDILAFTSIPKGDLLEGDHLVIETEPAIGTRVLLNGVLVQSTKTSALFNLILNAWIGARPPSSEFKRDMLTLPTGPAASALIARYDAVKPGDARRKTVAAWGVKPEPEAPASTVATQVTKPSEPARPAQPTKPAESSKPTPITPATASAPAPGRPVPAAPSAEAAPEQTQPAATPAPAAPTADTQTAAPAPQPIAPAEQAGKERQQTELYDQYLGQVRKQVLRHIDYPRRAQKEGIEGLVLLRINLDRNGNVTSSEVAQTANDLLDTAAQKAVNKAAPYPKPPEQLEGEQFQILVPVLFKFAQ